MSSVGAAPRAAVPPRCAKARRNPSEQCPRRGQPQERREVARARRRQRARRARRRMRSSTACARRSTCCCRRRTPPRSRRSRRDRRGAGAGRRPADPARAPRRGRRLAPGARRPHGSRGARVPQLRGRECRARPDPRRQRHPQLRHADALPQRRHGRVLARAQDAQGAPGRAGATQHAAGAQVRDAAEQPRAGAVASSSRTNPRRRPLHEYVIPDQAAPGRTLHEPASRWMPNEPEPGRDRHEVAAASPTRAGGAQTSG